MILRLPKSDENIDETHEAVNSEDDDSVNENVAKILNKSTDNAIEQYRKVRENGRKEITEKEMAIKSKKSEKSNVAKTGPSVIIDESKAIKYINAAKVITVQDLARQTDVKISEANSFLQKLLGEGTVERIGGFSGHHLYKSVSGK